MIATLVVLYAAKTSKTIQFQDFDRSILFKVSIWREQKHIMTFVTVFIFKPSPPLFSHQIFPLPLLFVGNHITGLASTKKLRFNHFNIMSFN